MFKKKKKVIPAEYGTIERRTVITPETENSPAQYETSTEQIVLRQAYEEVNGDIEWETTSERVLIEAAREIVLPDGEKALVPAKYKTITKQVIKTIHSRPPKSAIKFLYFFIPRDVREQLLGDIQEQYNNQLIQLGPKLANAWVWKECFFTFISLFINWTISKFALFDKMKKSTDN